MKIGILTFHRAENFGAVFQAYALQTFLGELGHEAYIIDYRCPAIEASYHIFNPSILWSRRNVFLSLKQYVERFGHIQHRIEKKKKYDSFRKIFLKQTSPVSSITQDMGFDAYIVGSDQVWNLHLTHGIDDVYFLNFPHRANSKLISYAASSENDPNGLICKNKEKVGNLLARFSSISVREDFLKDILTDLYATSLGKIEVSLDPTFLLSRSSYLKLVPERLISQKYILVYHMTPVEEGVRLAEKMALGKEMVVIEAFGGFTKKCDRKRYKQDLGPLELLNYIAYAESVITTSFHGVALSLILQKDFWVVNKGDNLRQRSILKRLNLQNRMISTAEEFNPESIDYVDVSSKLNELIGKSKSYLVNSLEK